MQSNSPSFSVGSGSNMGLGRYSGLGVVASYTFQEADGTTVVVMDDNSVYVLDPNTGVLTMSPDLTATMRQVNAELDAEGYPNAVQTEAASSFDFNSLLTNLSSIVTTYFAASTQKQLLQTNLQRASQGLPPLNAQAYMPGVNVGLASGTQNMVYIVAAGIGAVILLGVLGSKRK